MAQTNRLIVRGAHWLSIVFRPQYFPLVGFVILFSLTYLSLLPLAFKALVLLVVLIGTILLPKSISRLWQHARGWKRHELRQREKRLVPYVIHIFCYILTAQVIRQLHLPQYMIGILNGALLIQILCTLINLKWKISTHSAGAGGAIGALLACSFIFVFNPLWWLCLLILLSGLVGSSRMLLRQHDLWQVLAGTALGIVCGFVGIFIP